MLIRNLDHSLQLTTEGQGMMDALPVKSYSITTALAAQTALKSFHSGLTDCDFFKFLCLSDHDRPQGAKGQPQPQAKKASPQAAEFSIATSMLTFSLSQSPLLLTLCSKCPNYPPTASRTCSQKRRTMGYPPSCHSILGTPRSCPSQW